MEWLNYHHLLYFWVVAREGGLVPAGRVLRLSHPTLSAQIHALEDRLGEKLFVKVGRKLQLTEMGRLVYDYAEEIFSLGHELLDAVRGRGSRRIDRLNVGVVDVVPKLIVKHLLQPVLDLPEPVRLVCHEDTHDRLLAGLALHSLDIVISDAPVPSGASVRAFNHLLGETQVSLFGAPELVRSLRKGFPASLEGAPMLLPLENSTLRRALNRWFERARVRPKVVAEFEDSALLKVFGADGLGVFPAPSVMEPDVKAQHGVALLARLEGVTEEFWAISMERRLENPAVVAMRDSARHALFSQPK